MDTLLTAQAKSMAFGMGAHLVGVGNIERWENCPPPGFFLKIPAEIADSDDRSD